MTKTWYLNFFSLGLWHLQHWSCTLQSLPCLRSKIRLDKESWWATLNLVVLRMSVDSWSLVEELGCIVVIEYVHYDWNLERRNCPLDGPIQINVGFAYSGELHQWKVDPYCGMYRLSTIKFSEWLVVHQHLQSVLDCLCGSVQGGYLLNLSNQLRRKLSIYWPFEDSKPSREFWSLFLVLIMPEHKDSEKKVFHSGEVPDYFTFDTM